MIKTLLGHRDLATSQKYIHLSGELAPIRLASELVANAMQDAIEGGGKVQEIRPAAQEGTAKEATPPEAKAANR